MFVMHVSIHLVSFRTRRTFDDLNKVEPINLLSIINKLLLFFIFVVICIIFIMLTRVVGHSARRNRNMPSLLI